MTLDLAEMRAQYLRERVLFDRLATLVAGRLKKICYRRGIPCRIEARAKDVSSLLKKALAQRVGYSEIYDKAGARVVPTYSDDLHTIVADIKSVFEITWEEDKTALLGEANFGYRGYHLQVRVLDAEQDLRDLTCEIQVHTLGGGCWAALNHDVVYKTPHELPGTVKRSILRLSAMLEIVDREVGHVRVEVANIPDYAVNGVLHHLETHFYRLAGREYDSRFSIWMLGLVTWLWEAYEGAKAQIDEFVAANADVLERIFQEYAENGPDLTEGHLLLLQPEFVLLAFDTTTKRYV